MCLLIPELRNDCTSLSLRMREREIKLKGALSKKKNGTAQAARTGVWPEQPNKTARVWTKTIAV